MHFIELTFRIYGYEGLFESRKLAELVYETPNKYDNFE